MLRRTLKISRTVYARARARGLNQCDAARLAGSTGKDESCRLIGYRIERSDKVRSAIERERQRIGEAIQASANTAIGFLDGLVDGINKGTNQDRLAASALLLRAAGRMIERRDVNVTHRIPFVSVVDGTVVQPSNPNLTSPTVQALPASTPTNDVPTTQLPINVEVTHVEAFDMSEGSTSSEPDPNKVDALGGATGQVAGGGVGGATPPQVSTDPFLKYRDQYEEYPY